MPTDPRQDEVLDFWFREVGPHGWFEAGAKLDPVVRERFGPLHAEATRGALDDWARTPLGRLALVIVLDQFPRHIHRGDARSFADDPAALRLAREAVEAGIDEQLSMSQRHFLYMPLMHAEDPTMQALSIARFTALRDFAEFVLDFAHGHAREIERFGRFPGRNAALGRASTPEEEEFLAAGES